MEKEIVIPEGVNAKTEGKRVKISGSKGESERLFKYFFDIKIERKNDKIIVSSVSDRRKVKSMVGTIASHIKNMIIGVTKGFTYRMKVVYSHFPVTVKIENRKVLINNFLGEKRPRIARIFGDTKIDVQGQDIVLIGINKEDVGLTSSSIEQSCRISKFDRRVFSDGIYPVSKE